MGRQVPLQHVDNIPEWPGDRMSELSDFFTSIVTFPIDTHI